MSIFNYTKLMRFKTSFLIGLASLLGSWFYVSDYNTDLHITEIVPKLLAVFLLLVFSSGSLNLFNDIKDINIDKELKPERILPQGLVSIKNAYSFFFLSTLLCLLLSLFINMIVFGIYVIMFGIGVCYSLFFENIPLVKNIVVSFSISMSILVGYLSLIGNSDFNISIKMLVIFILSLFSILAFELQKDINDVEIDQKYNKRTFPAIFGKKKSSVLAYIIYWLIVLVLWLYLMVSANTNIYVILILILVQSYVLISIRNIITDQSFNALERARIRIYALFAITLVMLFSI